MTPDSKGRLVAAYVRQAEEALSRGAQQRASTFIDLALALDPQQPRAQELRGLLAAHVAEFTAQDTASGVPRSAWGSLISRLESATRFGAVRQRSGSGRSLSFLVAVVSGGAGLALIATAVLVTEARSSSPHPATAGTGCSLQNSSTAVVDASVLVITAAGFGTAFHIGDGVLITAAHVVDGNRVVLLDSELIHAEASVTRLDTRSDIAEMYSSAAARLPALAWSGEQLAPGLEVATVGYPVDVVGSGALSRGVISRLSTESGHQLIQTDVPVNPGSSGGALVDDCGNVLGIVVAKWNEVGIEGIAYAVDAASARRVLADDHP